MAPSGSTVSFKYFCCICDEYFQTVSNLHKHQTYMHSTEELSKAVLSLRGLELPTEYKTSDKLIAELYPLTNSLKKCNGFALNHYSKGIESTSEITGTAGSTSSERPKHYNHVKVICTENESYNSTGKINKKGNFEVLNNTDLNGLKSGILLESFEEQECTDYHENMSNETTEIDFDEDPYSIDFEDYFLKYKSSWHMSGDEIECAKGIINSQSLNLKANVSVAKSEGVINGTKDKTVSGPSCSIKSSNEGKVKKIDTQSADSKLLDAAVCNIYSPPENSKNLKRCSKIKVSRPLMQLLPTNTLQQSSAVKNSVKSKASVKPKLNDKMAIIPVSNTSESSFSNLNNTKNKKLLPENLKCSDSLSCPLVISQGNVTDKCTKSVKKYHLRQKSSLLRRKKVTETKDMDKLTTGMLDKKIICEPSMSRLTNNMLSKKSFTNSSEPSCLMNVNSLKHFFCEHCKKGYTKKYNVERHLRMHTGERRFSCSYCDKQFTVRTVLEQHVRHHTGEKPYSCKICQIQFPQKSGLMTHMMLHTGKPFKCNLCHKAFVSNYKLMKHLQSHHSLTTYTCKICKMLFPTEVALLEHSTVHKMAK